MSAHIPHNRKVTTMNDPQIWTLIGVFTAVMGTVLGVVTTSFTRTLRTELGAVREVMEVRFTSVERRLDNLDADVTAITKRLLD